MSKINSPKFKEYQVKDITLNVAMGPFGSRITKDNFVSEGVPVIKGQNLSDGRFNDEEFSYLTEEKADDLSSSNAFPDDLVFTHRGTLGQVGILPAKFERYVVSQSQMKLTCDPEKVDPMFFYYYFCSKGKDDLLKHKSGSGVPAISSPSTTLKNLTVEIPSLGHQKKIASILSAFDDLIENNTRRIEILEEMARRIYREWFVHFRYPSHQEDELVDSGTELGGIPDGWEVKKLDDLCELTLGQSPKSEFYNEKGEGLPFHQGVRDFGDRYPTTTTWCVKDKRIAEEGDILFSVRAPVGRINIANTRMIIGRGLHSIRSKFGNQVFIFHQLKDKFQEEDSMGSGTIYKSVTKKIMLNLKLIDPGEELIKKFEEKAVPIFNQIKTLTDKNEKLKEARDLLLPKLISGKIEVNHLMESHYE